eukprot:4926291-Pyramimonas_sp.AAC.1
MGRVSDMLQRIPHTWKTRHAPTSMQCMRGTLETQHWHARRCNHRSKQISYRRRAESQHQGCITFTARTRIQLHGRHAAAVHQGLRGYKREVSMPAAAPDEPRPEPMPMPKPR